MNLDSLIYGKNPLDRIVSIEPSDSQAEVFRELEDGSVISTWVPCSHWILFADSHNPKFKRLQGNQPYRFIMEYNSWAKYDDVLKQCYKKRMDLFAIRDPKEALMVKEGLTYFKGMKVGDVSVLSFDLEHTYGVGDTLKQGGKLLLIANTFRKQGKIIKKQFAYDDFRSEAEMIEAWVRWFCEMNPSVVTGWNLYGHDFRVLAFASEKVGVKLALGRNGSALRISPRTSQFRKDGSQSYDYMNMFIYGREIVDGWFLAMKYDGAARREYESYKLKYIIEREGLEKKGRQHYDASKIAENYHKPDEWKKIKKYNVDDGDDPLAFYDLTIASFFYYTQSIPRSFQQIINSATGSQINSLMVRAYLQRGHSVAKGDDKEKFEGAISFGVPGVHKNVFKIDVQSLYPSIILSKRICNRKKDPEELFLKIVDYFTQERIRNKEQAEATGERYFKDLSDSQKIAINSMYGFLGAPRLNYNSPEDAARVTEVGREILKKAIVWATGKDYVEALPDEGEGEDDAA
jgi:DNA polymerase, archaea type